MSVPDYEKGMKSSYSVEVWETDVPTSIAYQIYYDGPEDCQCQALVYTYQGIGDWIKTHERLLNERKRVD